MATIREFVTTWGFEIDDRKLKMLDKNVEKVNKRLEAGARVASRVGRGLTLGLTLPIAAAAGAAIKFASDAEETKNKFNELFGSLGDEAENASRRLEKSFKLAESTSKDLLGATGDILQGFGLTDAQALQLSETVQGLSADIASFKNVQGGTERASRIITKALVGERVALKESLGTQITAEEIKKRAIEIQREQTDLTLQQAEAFATVRLIQEKNTKALGDFNRTLSGGANSFRVFQELLKGVAESFGEILLPPALQILSVINDMLEAVKEMNPFWKTTILLFAGLAAAFGPILIFTGLMLTSIVAIRRALILMRLAGIQSFTALLLPLLKIIAVAAILMLVFEDLFGFFTGKRSLFGLIISQALDAFNFLEKKFNGLPTIVKRAIGIATAPIRGLISLVRGIGGALGALSVGDFSGALDAAKGIASDFLSGFTADTLSGALGFGSEQSVDQQIGSLAGVQAVRGGGPSNVTQQTTNNVSVTVPQGTPPDQVAPAVERGIKTSMDEMMRKTQRQLTTAVVN